MEKHSTAPISQDLAVGLLCGIYGARLHLELAPPPPHLYLLGFVLALSLGLLVGLALAHLTQRRWPALLLLIYILYPGISPHYALIAGTLALTAALVDALPRRYLDLIVLLVALAIYTHSAAPGLLPADEGELQRVVAQMGIAHPPGYPLYTLTGWAFTQLPLGSPAHRANLLSALTAALTLAVVSHTARRETHRPIAGIAAALTLGSAASFWATATQASVRPMTALFVALLLDALLAYRRAVQRHTHQEARALTRFALCLGLGVGHHASIIFVGTIFTLALLAADPALLRRPRRWVGPGAALLAGFLPWLYLPLRGAALGTDLAGWDGFWQHVLARGFGGDMFYYHTLGALLTRLRTLCDVLAFQWQWLVPVVGALAALLMLWRARWLLFTLGGAFALHTLVAAGYRAPQTVEYMIPAYLCLALAVGWLAGWVCSVHLYRPLRIILSALVILGGVLSAVATHPGMAYRHAHEDTHRVAQCLLEDTPAGAVLLANWHWSTPLQYLQQIEGARPDVTVAYVYPEGAEPLRTTWARRIETYLSEGRPVVVQSYYPGALPDHYFEPQLDGPGWLVRTTPRRAVPPGFRALDIAFEGGLSLAGMREAPDAGQSYTVVLAWRVDAPTAHDITGFVHLVDAQGRVLRQDDVLLSTAGAAPGTVILTRYTLARPPTGALMAGLYIADAEGVTALRPRAGGERAALGDIDAAAQTDALSPPGEHPRYTVFEDGLILTGYDYDLSLPGRARLYLHWAYRGAGWADYDLTLSQSDVLLDTAHFRATPGAHFSTAHDIAPDTTRVRLALQAGGCLCLQRVLGPFGLAVGYSTDLPGPHPGDRYVPLGNGIVLTGAAVRAPVPLSPGAVVEVTLRFRSAYPLAEDDVVKVDLIETGWAWRVQSDHIPATGAIPTLKWTWGSRIIDRHRLTVPDQATGEESARLVLLLYDHFTGRPLPILDPALAAQGQTLGIWTSDRLQ